MKRIKISLAALAFVFAIGTAFAHKAADPQYHYFRNGQEIDQSELTKCKLPVTDDCYEVYDEDMQYITTRQGTWVE